MLHRAVGGVDRAVGLVGEARDLGGGEQVAVVEPAHRPEPFAQRLVVEADAVERERALRCRGARARGRGPRRRAAQPFQSGAGGDAELLGGEQAVEVGLAARGRCSSPSAASVLAQLAQRARAPVAPRAARAPPRAAAPGSRRAPPSSRRARSAARAFQATCASVSGASPARVVLLERARVVVHAPPGRRPGPRRSARRRARGAARAAPGARRPRRACVRARRASGEDRELLRGARCRIGDFSRAR